MTWAEFKAAVEAQGVTDSDEIEYIDMSYSVEVHFDKTYTPPMFHVVDGDLG